jgi:TPR repeat protein
MNGEEHANIMKDTDKAIKLFHRAADLGSAIANENFGLLYDTGDGVSKDMVKAKQYHEKGAMAGCATSRLNLGVDDANDGNFDRAIKHWLIAASSGDIRAVNDIKKAMIEGHATKDHYARALR